MDDISNGKISDFWATGKCDKEFCTALCWPKKITFGLLDTSGGSFLSSMSQLTNTLEFHFMWPVHRLIKGSMYDIQNAFLIKIQGVPKRCD